MLDATTYALQKRTPKTGFNLCEIDDYEFPPDNLVFVEHFDTLDGVEQYLQANRDASIKYIVIGAGGSTFIESNPGQARDERGRWTSIGGAAESIAQRTIHGQGGSFSTHGEPAPKTGYMVAEDGHERVVTVGNDRELATQAVRQYMNDKKAELSRPSVYLGTWLESGQLFIDNSHNIIDRSTAFAFAKDNNQLAVYNVGGGKVENTMSDGERPKDSKGTLTEADAKEAPHKMFFSPSTSPEEIVKTLFDEYEKRNAK